MRRGLPPGTRRADRCAVRAHRDFAFGWRPGGPRGRRRRASEGSDAGARSRGRPETKKPADRRPRAQLVDLRLRKCFWHKTGTKSSPVFPPLPIWPVARSSWPYGNSRRVRSGRPVSRARRQGGRRRREAHARRRRQRDELGTSAARRLRPARMRPRVEGGAAILPAGFRIVHRGKPSDKIAPSDTRRPTDRSGPKKRPRERVRGREVACQLREFLRRLPLMYVTSHWRNCTAQPCQTLARHCCGNDPVRDSNGTPFLAFGGKS